MKVSVKSIIGVDGVMISVSVNVNISLADNVISSASVVDASIISLLGVSIILVTLNIGLDSVEVETGIAVTDSSDVGVRLEVTNKDTSLVDGLVTVGLDNSTKLNVSTSEVNNVVSTVALASGVESTTSVGEIVISTIVVVFINGVDKTEVVMTEETTDSTGLLSIMMVVSMGTTVIVGIIISVSRARLVVTRSLCIDKLSALDDGVANTEDENMEEIDNVGKLSTIDDGISIGEDVDVGEIVSKVGIDVSMPVNKGEFVSVITEGTVGRVKMDGIEIGILVGDKTSVLVVGDNIGITDVVSTSVIVTKNISVLLNNVLVVMAAVSSDVVKVSEGVIITSVVKELRIVRLENGIDTEAVVTSTSTEILDTEVVTKTGILRKDNEGDVLKIGELAITVEMLVISITDMLDIVVVEDNTVLSKVKPNVVWSAENKVEVVSTGTTVVGSTVITGEDGKMVTTETIVSVKVGAEENVAIGVVVTGSVTVDMATVVVEITSVAAAVVRTT